MGASPAANDHEEFWKDYLRDMAIVFWKSQVHKFVR